MVRSALRTGRFYAPGNTRILIKNHPHVDLEECKMYLCVTQDLTNVAFDFVDRLIHYRTFRILKERLPPPIILAVRTVDWVQCVGYRD